MYDCILYNLYFEKKKSGDFLTQFLYNKEIQTFSIPNTPVEIRSSTILQKLFKLLHT